MSKKYLGLDLGGTNIKIAIIEKSDSGWNVIFKDQVSTSAEKGPDYVVSLLADLAKKYGPEVDGVGIAVPGIFNHEVGTIQLFPNLPGPWKDHAMLEPVAKASGKPTGLINDARAFSLAESIMGAARGYETVACLVLGTGVGGGIVINGKVLMGATKGAGEIAHQMVNPDGPLCGCGAKGCAEAMTSTKAICDLAGTKTPEEAYKNALAGDERAINTFKEVAKWLAVALYNVMTIVSPNVYVIGGGVAQAGELLFDYIKEEFKSRNHLWPDFQALIIPAQLGPAAGSIGAALHGASTDGQKLNLISTT